MAYPWSFRSLFSLVAKNGGSLKTLELPGSGISDDIVERIIGKLTKLTFLDLSYCTEIGSRGLDTIGKHCKFLVGLRRSMREWKTDYIICKDDEACAIASTMPKLRRLEMCFVQITTEGVSKVLSQCTELEYLDVSGCRRVKLDAQLLKEKHPRLKVLGLKTDCIAQRLF